MPNLNEIGANSLAQTIKKSFYTNSHAQSNAKFVMVANQWIFLEVAHYPLQSI